MNQQALIRLLHQIKRKTKEQSNIFVLEDFEVNFLIIMITPFLGKLRFLKFSLFSDSETLFKYKN